MTHARPRDNRGIALLLALAVLVALGSVTLTAFALARGERLAGLASLGRVQARGAAEAALSQALLGWPDVQVPARAGDSALLAQVQLPGPAQGQAWLHALGGPVYAIESWGLRLTRSGAALGSVRLELLVLPNPADSTGWIRPKPYPRGMRVLP